MRYFKGDGGFTLSELAFVIFAVVFTMALMVPLMRSASDLIAKKACADNLRQIGLAMYIYAQEHGGKFPDDIDTLYREKYLADEGILDCIASRTKGDRSNPDYIYTGGLSVKSPSLEPLVMDRGSNHTRGGKNILCVNGSVVWRD
jgi:competence protein ComGC